MQHHYNTFAHELQPTAYIPAPREVAYVSELEQGEDAGRYVITVSPTGWSGRGLWYQDNLPGTYPTENSAQRELNEIAKTEGWRALNWPDEWEA